MIAVLIDVAYHLAVTHSSGLLIGYWDGGLALNFGATTFVIVVAAAAGRWYPRVGRWLAFVGAIALSLEVVALLLSFPTLGATFIPSAVLGWLAWRAIGSN